MEDKIWDLRNTEIEKIDRNPNSMGTDLNPRNQIERIGWRKNIPNRFSYVGGVVVVLLLLLQGQKNETLEERKRKREKVRVRV